jgi:nucleotide-binding universal stress UspA family protein
VDGSESSLAALRWALDQANSAGGEIEAVLAYDYGFAWIDVGSDAQAAWMQGAADRAHGALRRALRDSLPDPPPVTVHGIVVEGAPADVLVEVARHADLLVVGTRGRGGFAGLLLGSVSQRCAERAECPVVVVPQPKVDEVAS